MPFDGQPTLRGSLLELRPLRSDDFAALYRVAAGADGTYRFDHLAPDDYKVSATMQAGRFGARFYSQQATVVSGQDIAVDLAAEHAHPVRAVCERLAPPEPRGISGGHENRWHRRCHQRQRNRTREFSVGVPRLLRL